MAFTPAIVRPNFDPLTTVSNPMAAIGPVQKWIPITVGQYYGNSIYARFILVGGDSGNMTYINWSGETITNLPISAGQQYFMTSILVVSTTSSNLWAGL